MAAKIVLAAVIPGAVLASALLDAEWALPVNTFLLILLGITQRSARQQAKVAASEARGARSESAYTGRVVKESHNTLTDLLARKYEDVPDDTTHKFEPRRRSDDPDPPPKPSE